eukprot:scaffold338_cov116-Cylindrotheca_fusiformis.AAC.11
MPVAGMQIQHSYNPSNEICTHKMNNESEMFPSHFLSSHQSPCNPDLRNNLQQGSNNGSSSPQPRPSPNSTAGVSSNIFQHAIRNMPYGPASDSRSRLSLSQLLAEAFEILEDDSNF